VRATGRPCPSRRRSTLRPLHADQRRWRAHRPTFQLAGERGPYRRPLAHRKPQTPVTPIPDPALKPTLSVEEAGRLLGISRTTAYNAAKTGDIPTIKISGRKLVPTARLRDLLGIADASPPQHPGTP
jgi:excisionase family DNA binding protein